uniref:Uncharacterized protein n=1 Tax=Cacopsylla melanoneura TaxID=428564 RepID=A0A8D8LMJ0_9HEMI
MNGPTYSCRLLCFIGVRANIISFMNGPSSFKSMFNMSCMVFVSFNIFITCAFILLDLSSFLICTGLCFMFPMSALVIFAFFKFFSRSFIFSILFILEFPFDSSFSFSSSLSFKFQSCPDGSK